MSVARLSPLLLLASCGDCTGRGAVDAGVDAAPPRDACPDSGCGGRDAGPDASDASADGSVPGWPRVSGGCEEIRTVEERRDRLVSANEASLASTPDGFLVLLSGAEGEECVLRSRDLDGELVSEAPVVDPDVCGYDTALAVRGDGTVLVLDTDQAIWAGTVDGDGSWVASEWPTKGPANDRIRIGPLDAEGLFVARPGMVLRMDWSGSVVGSIERLPSPQVTASGYALPGISWSGSTLGVAWRDTPDEESWDRVYFQRFDADLVALDPEPLLVAEYREELVRSLDSRSPILLGWDGSEFGVVIASNSGHGDWGEPPLTDVYRFGEVGESLGSFPLNRGGIDAYAGDRLILLLDAPDRVIIAQEATYHGRGEDGKIDIAWEGLDLAPIDLSTGERVGEDGRLWMWYRMRRMVVNGTRIAFLWWYFESVDEHETEWVDMLNLTVLDCAGVFGDG